ncbi:MAG: signal peptide peptidase SppA [Armatimonadetes bacterium]|nr:signal peptide peptidase SppA [Armatimonadota bacterium]
MRRKIIAGAVIGIVFLSLVIWIAVAATRAPGEGAVVRGRSAGAVGVIAINGVITCGRSSSGLWSAQTGSEDVLARLREAAGNPEIKAVVLRLNSPGGTASGAQEIAGEVDRLRQTGKKVVASMGDVAASGAYWIASRTDKIIANPGTLTGSIGVIMETQDLRGLYEKIGVGTETFKSGPHKDMGSPARAVTPEERAIFQSMVDDIYEQFLAAVAEGRKMDVAALRSLADGRVFTGRQAFRAGLVDELGNYRAAVGIAGDLAGLGSDPRVVELGPKGLWQELLGGSRESVWKEFLKPALPGRVEEPARYPALWLLCPADYLGE